MRDHRHPIVVDGVVVDSGGDDSGYYYDCCSTDDAVGYREAPYGAWGRPSEMPHLAIELGTGMRRFGDPLASQLGTKASVDSAITTQLRFLVHMHGALYLGAEGELGGLMTHGPSTGTTDPMMSPTSAMVFGGAGVVGAMSRQGNAAFGVELAVGGRSVVYQFETLDEKSAQSATSALVEPRARAQYWVTPFVALGAQAGANIINRGDWMAGAFLSLHTRAFGND